MEFRQVCLSDAAALSVYYHDNAAHLAPWEPIRPQGFNDIDAWQHRLEERTLEQANQRAAYFVAVLPDNERIIACCNLNNVVRGVFQACHMGYSVAAPYQGQGIMTSLCQHAIDHAFHTMALHRVMANYMPRNHRSAALLKKLGFVQEGLARRYLHINGRWEDHVLTSLIRPE